MLKNKVKAIAVGVAGVGSMLGLALSNMAHAQFVLSTTTLNTDNGGYLQNVYSYLSSSLGSGGVVLFVIVLTIFAGIIGLIFWGLHRIFGRGKIR